MVTTAEIPKKKRVSKKLKSSWRKHVDITDVEEYLEDKRLEERIGKASEKTDEQLFVLDTGEKPKQVRTSKQQRRELLRNTIPKCFSILQPQSQVKDPVIKRNRLRTKEERKNKLVKLKEESQRANGMFKLKDLQRWNDIKLAKMKKANIPQRGDAVANDIWAVGDNTETEWISKQALHHTLTGSGKVPKKIPKITHEKRSVLPTIEAPHPGTSYNPTYTDHQTLLKDAVEKESKIIKEEAHIHRCTRAMFSKVTEQQKNEMWMKEMLQGIVKEEGEVKDEPDSDEFHSINPPVKNKKKDLKQRRKQREQLELQKTRSAVKVEKKKVADIYKLRFLDKEIERTESKASLLRDKREKRKKLKALEPKRLSKVAYEPDEVYFNNIGDLCGNLRNLKPEGSMLRDRYKSMQKRNILEPAVKQRAKKGKIKRFNKPGHKDDWKTTVSRAKA